MKTFIQIASQKNHIIHTVRYEVLGSYQRFLSFADKETAKEIILQWMRKTFHALSPLHFLMGKCTAGVKCSLDITSKNIVSSTERKSTESAKDLLKTNVLGPWLHQDNSKELVISKYTWWRNSLRTSSVAVCRGIKSCQRQAGLLPAQTI